MIAGYRASRGTVGNDHAHEQRTTIMKRSEGIAYLTNNGQDTSRVPCSRYGRDTEDCAPVAWRLAYLVARESGEPVTIDGLDHAMSLVVNDHDDVTYVIKEYGNSKYR